MKSNSLAIRLPKILVHVVLMNIHEFFFLSSNHVNIVREDSLDNSTAPRPL